MSQNESVKKINTYNGTLGLIAANVKKLRKQKGLTQEDMVEYGFNYRFYQKLESGKYSPNLQTLFKLSQALEVNIVKFFES